MIHRISFEEHYDIANMKLRDSALNKLLFRLNGWVEQNKKVKIVSISEESFSGWVCLVVYYDQPRPWDAGPSGA